MEIGVVFVENHREKTKMVAEGVKPILGFHLSEHGGITVGPTVIDQIKVSLNGLFADPESPLFEKVERARVIIQSTLAYYEIAENSNELISQVIEHLKLLFQSLNLLPLEIAVAANIEIHRVDEAHPINEADLIDTILIHSKKLAQGE